MPVFYGIRNRIDADVRPLFHVFVNSNKAAVHGVVLVQSEGAAHVLNHLNI